MQNNREKNLEIADVNGNTPDPIGWNCVNVNHEPLEKQLSFHRYTKGTTTVVYLMF